MVVSIKNTVFRDVMPQSTNIWGASIIMEDEKEGGGGEEQEGGGVDREEGGGEG